MTHHRAPHRAERRPDPGRARHRRPRDGPVVVLCHPAPGSRTLDPDPAATAAAGVRLVSLDRPGYGGSSPVPAAPCPPSPARPTTWSPRSTTSAPVPAAWPAGPRAAAWRWRWPPATRAWSAAWRCVATPAPQEAVPWIPDEHLAMLDPLRADPAGATARLAEVFAEPGGHATRGGRGPWSAGGPTTRPSLAADPGRRARLAAMLARRPSPRARSAWRPTSCPTRWPPGASTRRRSPPPPRCSTATHDAGGGAGPRRVVRGAGARGRHSGSSPGAGHLVGLTAWGDVLAALD